MNMANNAQRSVYLSPENLVRYLTGLDDEIDTLISCKGTQVSLATYDLDLYEAVGTLEPTNELKTHRLLKILEVVDILPFRKAANKDKPVLTHERVAQLRQKALNR